MATGSDASEEDFSQRVHAALRSWHAQVPEGSLGKLRLADRLKIGDPTLTANKTSNQILSDGLKLLRQLDEKAADLLEGRFDRRQTADEVAEQLSLTKDAVYQRQRAAILQLAAIIEKQEGDLSQQRIERINARLGPLADIPLFGVEGKLAEAQALLTGEDAPWLLAIEGMGGNGKTSLADALVRRLAPGARFHDIAWISVRRRMLRFSGDFDSLLSQPLLTMAELIDRCCEQFGLGALAHASDEAKLAGLKNFLRSRPCLVVVDNLETAQDCEAVVPGLAALTNPSKFVFTTRYSLRDVNGVYILPLAQLSEGDALALIAHEARTRNLPELVSATQAQSVRIYDVTGGNPLAIKLVVGQIHGLSLPAVLAQFDAVSGGAVDALLGYIYDAAWLAVDAECRQVLMALLRVGDDGGQLDQIAFVAGLSEAQAAACLHRLSVLSLVNASGTLSEKRFSLHPLTQVYVARQAASEAEEEP